MSGKAAQRGATAVSRLATCQCYLDTGGHHLCLQHRDSHVCVWETVTTTAGYVYRCVLCSAQKNADPQPARCGGTEA